MSSQSEAGPQVARAAHGADGVVLLARLEDARERCGSDEARGGRSRLRGRVAPRRGALLGSLMSIASVAMVALLTAS